MFEKKAITRTPIIDALAERWSGRAYDASRGVDPDALVALLEAARWAPSCSGYQPWRFVIWDRNTDHASYQTALDCLVDANRVWAQHAPVLLLACADTLFADGKVNRWAQYDTGAALMSLSTQATSLGLMVHQMGGFDAKRVKQDFCVPDAFDCLAMVTIGYQLAVAQIPENLEARELAPRSRRELGESFFKAAWGQPWC